MWVHEFQSYPADHEPAVEQCPLPVLGDLNSLVSSSIPPFLSLQPCSTSKGAGRKMNTATPAAEGGEAPGMDPDGDTEDTTTEVETEAEGDSEAPEKHRRVCIW